VSICPITFNSGHKTEKDGRIFLSPTGVHLVLQVGNDGFSGLFRMCSEEKRKNVKHTGFVLKRDAVPRQLRYRAIWDPHFPHAPTFVTNCQC